ncbi:MAG: Acetyltransferase (GNAT) family protein [Betaproteobacteria bacterium ADurb.Bin341]|nr:MAG: Acetyltransferase (GNAT) family protein [Betaproteobacteria bacterium ADurb.Bin341]
MANPALTIRAAKVEDIPFLVWVMETAGRSGLTIGFFDAIVPESVEERHDLMAQLATTEPRSVFYYSNFLVAEIDGVLVGGVSGYYTPQVHSEHFRQVLSKVLDQRGWSESRRAEMMKRLGTFVGCFPGLLEEAWVVEWVAVKPEYRRMGIISALMRAIIDQGIHTTPCKVIQIAVLIGNTPAYNTYIKSGFQYFDEKCTPEFKQMFGTRGMVRLVIYPQRNTES